MGLKRDRALAISGLSKHAYYYKPKSDKKRGARCSETTQLIKGQVIVTSPNSEVIEKIEDNHDDPDLTYGYQKMAIALKILGYLINHKKVYRLMKSHQLLQNKSQVKAKQYARYRILCPEQPLECLEMDIKFVWVEEYKRHVYVLTIIDVFTRMVLAWHAGRSITQHTVKAVFSEVIINHLQPNDMLRKGINIEIRNDNDPRFSAKLVQDFFKKNYLNQVFTHPYTPQENGHIESFHAILDRSLSRFHFQTLDQLDMHLTIFYDKYNNQRLHGSIAHLPPRIFWTEWENGHIQRTVNAQRKVKFKLLKPYHKISGSEILKEASCQIMQPSMG